MSKDIATAMLRMLEYGRAMNKPAKPSRNKQKMNNRFNIDDLDLAEVYLRLDAREKKIKASKEAIEKMMKKDDKKDDKKIEVLSIPRLAMILVASFPITAPLYVLWISNALRAAGWK